MQGLGPRDSTRLGLGDALRGNSWSGLQSLGCRVKSFAVKLLALSAHLSHPKLEFGIGGPVDTATGLGLSGRTNAKAQRPNGALTTVEENALKRTFQE